MASLPTRPKGRSIKNLRMVWSFALAYPGHIAVAAAALAVAAAAAVSIPGASSSSSTRGSAPAPAMRMRSRPGSNCCSELSP